MGTSQERRPFRESNATWTGPLSEAMPACRGRRADHAQKDRVGTWEIPRPARAIPLLVRIGKGKPIADDERTREVGPSSSSCEAGEQGARLSTCALQQVVGYLGYTGRAANVIAKSARDATRTFTQILSPAVATISKSLLRAKTCPAEVGPRQLV